MNRMVKALGGTAVVASVLAGCGDDGGSMDVGIGDGAEAIQETADAAEAPRETADGDCRFITESEVAGAMGRDVDLTLASEIGCTFRAADMGPFIGVDLTEDVAGDLERHAETAARDICGEQAQDVDAGDLAFACQHDAGLSGAVYSGADSISINVLERDDEEDTELEAIVELLLLVRI